jgi:hypothetical protein
MKCEVDRSRISKIVSDMSEHSREVMEKTFILATVFNSDVYIISAVKMPKVAVEEITSKVVMFVTNIYYPYTGIANFLLWYVQFKYHL